jgi:NADH-quinone oxidoreductase subunit G
MPKLIIDDLEIEVGPGTKVIAAAEQLGIMIPRFCYHPGLGSIGACRMCAVKFLQGPVKGLQMSCMVEAKDGMVVSSTDEDAVDFRKHVIEWLMLHHPHDCPVCDEGGHCLLQDETVSGGHGIRRYRGKKRTYRDQYLGVLVQHEMNRCIHCYRCRRFYQDFAGYRDLGAMQIANRVYFGRYSEGPLQSPFAGNLIDVCPTGVYTDKPSRFKGRRWDFERGSSLCIHCSLGCHTVASARYREVVRLEAGFSEAVNGYFICDRGRYGFYYTNHSDRPRHARIAGEEVGGERRYDVLEGEGAPLGDLERSFEGLFRLRPGNPNR